MAKILSVDLQSVPKYINVGDDISDLTVITTIEFHPLDLKLEMEYCLHLFVYDIHGEVDPPLVLPNWDESDVISLAMDREDEFLGMASQKLVATKKDVEVSIPIALKLGDRTANASHFTKKLEVFATIAPAVGRASKWAEPFESRLIH